MNSDAPSTDTENSGAPSPSRSPTAVPSPTFSDVPSTGVRPAGGSSRTTPSPRSRTSVPPSHATTSVAPSRSVSKPLPSGLLPSTGCSSDASSEGPSGSGWEMSSSTNHAGYGWAHEFWAVPARTAGASTTDPTTRPSPPSAIHRDPIRASPRATLASWHGRDPGARSAARGRRRSGRGAGTAPGRGWRGCPWRGCRSRCGRPGGT